MHRPRPLAAAPWPPGAASQVHRVFERALASDSDFLPALQRELIAIVQKYVAARDEAIEVRMGQHGGAAVLEINIELPPKGKTPAAR